jgi:phosphoribosylformimino-5-aminoimidazole carboxamide ribotide isomerase
VHLGLVERIRRETRLRIELGGGIRSLASAREAASLAERIVIGTAAVKDPEMLRNALAELGDRVAVGIDARGGRVAISGWETPTPVAAEELARDVRDMGVVSVIFTDVETDGTLEGPNLTALKSMRAVDGLFLIASGGIGTLDHLRALRAAGADACIIGKALYEGAFTLSEALQC